MDLLTDLTGEAATGSGSGVEELSTTASEVGVCGGHFVAHGGESESEGEGEGQGEGEGDDDDDAPKATAAVADRAALLGWSEQHWALEYHTLKLFLKGTIMKKKFILFSPWLLKSPDR